MESILVLITFWGLLGGTIVNQQSRKQLRNKTQEDWLLDGLGLGMQGVVIPLLQLTIVYQIYHFLFPGLAGCLHISAIEQFCLSFIGVDYCYYWNHRWLHTRSLWSLHQVHHTVTEMDVMATSRNTLWTSFFIIYLWIHALFLYFLTDPTMYLIGVSISSALDLWRHSGFVIPQQSWVYAFLNFWLILPQDHAWHHASESSYSNFGANLKLWDRLHGTYHEKQSSPMSLGISTTLTLSQKLFKPFL